MKSKTAILAAMAAIAGMAAGCGGKPEASSEKAALVQGATIEKVGVSPVEDYYEATGTVKSRTTTVVASRIMGTVTALRVHEGDRVRAGQMLVEIDNREAAAQLQKAEAGLREAQDALVEIDQSMSAAQSAQAGADANLRLANSTFERYQSLYERKSVSPQEFDEAKAKQQVAAAEADRAAKMLQMIAAKKNQVMARIDQARADVTNARVSAGYSRVTSPINGLVTAKSIEVGSTASPGSPLLTIEDGSNYRLEVAVEESQLGRIRLRDQARMRIDALGSEELSGSVAEILPAADPMSRSYIVKIALPARQMLRSGLYGTARFPSGGRKGIVIPRRSIVQRGQLIGVFVVDDQGIARLRLVKTGKTYGESVEILSGLSEGEQIVVDGLAKVNDGSRVR